MDHPYDSDVVQFPNGDVIYGGLVLYPPLVETNASLVHGLEVRAQDASFVLNALGLSCFRNLVMFGHSFGGAAAATAMRYDFRIRSGVNLDGLMLGPVIHQGFRGTEKSNPDRSFLLWSSEGHNTSSDSTWSQFCNALKPDVPWLKEVGIMNSAHDSYWDVPTLIDAAGIRDQLPEEALEDAGPIGGQRILQILGTCLPACFRFALGLAPESPLFERPSSELPDVEILRGR